MKVLIFIFLFQTCLCVVSTQGQSTPNISHTYFIVFLTTTENEDLDPDQRQRIENDHLRNIGKLYETGILANAGPIEGGNEIMLLNTETLAETEELLALDPAIHNKILIAEILSLEIRKGNVCKALFPYEMITYTFVRYAPTNQIASYKTNQDFDMKRLHERHLEKLLASDQVIMEGIFAGNDGGVLIYSGNALENTIADDPAIKDGYLTAESKTIWLNKGSFCNN